MHVRVLKALRTHIYFFNVKLFNPGVSVSSLSLPLFLPLPHSLHFFDGTPNMGYQVWQMQMLHQGIHPCIYRGSAICLEMGQTDKTKTNKAHCLFLKCYQRRCNANITELFCSLLVGKQATKQQSRKEGRLGPCLEELPWWQCHCKNICMQTSGTSDLEHSQQG